jgi:hypothetical protein
MRQMAKFEVTKIEEQGNARFHADRMFARVIATDEGTTISCQAQISKRAKRT